MYCQELWLVLAVGFLISGFFYTFVPENLIERHLGEKGLKPILISSFFGALLPVCCIGSLPIAVTLRRKGAALGAVLAFLVATPATSVSALIVCWKLLGLTFTVFIFFAIIIMAIALGMIINSMKWDAVSTQESQGRDSCCCHAKEVLTIWQKLRNALFYAFVTLPKEIGVEILIGIAVASFITVFEPIQHVIRDYLVGAVGYLFVLIVGLMTYVCSTASVPMADAFLK
ncbi:MAG TPA: permease, partial [Candidatus Omnitrophota bacterium]|nr:permease [Candidatus Omnitrophota bacterium]